MQRETKATAKFSSPIFAFEYDKRSTNIFFNCLWASDLPIRQTYFSRRRIKHDKISKEEKPKWENPSECVPQVVQSSTSFLFQAEGRIGEEWGRNLVDRLFIDRPPENGRGLVLSKARGENSTQKFSWGRIRYFVILQERRGIAISFKVGLIFSYLLKRSKSLLWAKNLLFKYVF